MLHLGSTVELNLMLWDGGVGSEGADKRVRRVWMWETLSRCRDVQGCRIDFLDKRLTLNKSCLVSVVVHPSSSQPVWLSLPQILFRRQR